MKYKSILLLKFILSFIFFFSSTSSTTANSLMSSSDREERWEFSFQTQYLDSIDINFDGGAQAALNEAWNWGFGIGYNFDEHWAIDLDINWNDAGYSGTRIDDSGDPQTVSGTLNTNSMLVTGIYNFSEKRFTPFVSASLGWTFVDTNIPTGPPQTSCWWDPWWGYICSNYIPTRTSTELTYGATAGLRFDVRDNVFLRISAGKKWIDFDNTGSTPDFTTYRFDIGLMF